MLNDFFKQFKSGTDIRGVASEGVKGQDVNLTDDVIASMADGFVLWLSDKVNKAPNKLTISVGRDSRISGPRIMKITTNRFKKCGANVLCCNLASTPSMFMTTVDLKCDGALQITASHHPFNRNGLKFFTREGGLEGSDIEQILLYAQNNEHPEKSEGGKITVVDYMSDYAKGLCEKIKKEVYSFLFVTYYDCSQRVQSPTRSLGTHYERCKNTYPPLGSFDIQKRMSKLPFFISYI